MEQIVATIQKLPEMNKQIILVLIALFRKLTQNSNTTFMTAENLGIVWGPNFLRPKAENSETILDMPFVAKMISILITCQDALPIDDSIFVLTSKERQELQGLILERKLLFLMVQFTRECNLLCITPECTKFTHFTKIFN